MSVIWSGVTEEGAVVPVQVDETGKVIATAAVPGGDYVKKTGDNMTGDLTFDEAVTLGVSGNAKFVGDVETGAGYANGGGCTLFSNGMGTADERGAIVAKGVPTVTTDASAILVTTGSSNPVTIRYDGSATFASTVQVGGDPFPGTTIGSALYDDGSIALTSASSDGTVFFGYTLGDSTPTTLIRGNGSASFAGNKCGFTSAGELFFTSRNSRYKLVVQDQLVLAEPYTRQMELKEKAEQFIADKRETKPSDPDPSDPQGGMTMDIDNSSPN